MSIKEVVRLRRTGILVAVLALLTCATLFVVFLFTSNKTEEKISNMQTLPSKSGSLSESSLKSGYVTDISPPRLSFDPSASNINIPVNGQLQVKIEPKDLENLPETIKVYEMMPLVTSEKELRVIADRLGMHGNSFSATSVSERDNKRNLVYRELWYDSYEDTLNYFDNVVNRQRVNSVPSKEKCKEIAWTIAEEKGLLCPEATIIAMNETSTSDRSADDSFFVVKRDIVIGRNIDGLEVRGPGCQLRMTLGADGKLISIFDCLRPLNPIGTYRLKPLQQALEEATKGQGTVNLQPDTLNPTVANLGIFYYAETSSRTRESDQPSQQNRALLPVYAFKSDDCCIYVPAFGDPIDQAR